MAKIKEKKVCVSGYFDPLHVGHISYLEIAKKLGGKLVVIVNNDFQAVLKKGKYFMNQKDRMKIMKSLKVVDEVVLSIDEDLSVCKTLNMIKPDIFGNGGDRHSRNIPEKNICDELKIEIVSGLGTKIRSSRDYYGK